MVKIDHIVAPHDSQSLRYSQTIQRHLVHKSSIHEVFITDTRTTNADSFLVGAQLPRQHTLYSDRIRKAYDPLLIAEACRQATIVMAHQYFNVPLGWLLLGHKAEIKISEKELLSVGKQPANILISVQVLQKKFNKEVLLEAVLMHTVSLGGRVVAYVQGEIKGMPKNMYAYMREVNKNNKDLRDLFGDVNLTELDPGLLGRHDRRNVVINDSLDPEKRVYPAKIDRTHPGFFDHEVDHVSAAVLAEICRQASFRHITQDLSIWQNSKLDDWEIIRLRMNFTEIAEFGTPIYCRVVTVDPSGQGAEFAVTLEILQGSATLGRANVLWNCE